MEQNNEEMQVLAVEKVLEEMKHAEDFLMKWNAHWWQRYEDIVFPEEYGYRWDREEDNLIMKFLCEGMGYRIYEPLPGKPLKVVSFKYNYSIYTINWLSITTNNSIRKIKYSNNGDIFLSKESKRRRTEKKPKTTSYTANYNVLSDDFELDIAVNTLQSKRYGEHKYETLSISLKNNILTRIYKDIEIIDDLNTGFKYIKISQKNSKNHNASILFEALYNENSKLEAGSVAINTHKGNGKINGTYRFDVSKTKGIRANFYSRKGVKVDLTTNPILLENVNALMLPSNTNDSNDVNGIQIVSNFTNSAQENIAKNLNERVTIFDTSNFNMGAVNNAETIILSIIKEIKGEIPLKGLVERIDNCIAIIEKKNKPTSNNKVKTLKLKSSN